MTATMKHLTRIPLVAACAAGCLGTTVALAAAASQTITLTSVQVSAKQGRDGFTAKDDDFHGKKKIGHDVVVCRFAGRTAACQVTVTLAKGSIRATFRSGENISSGPLKIVGGTGAYKGATGSGHFKNLNRAGTKTSVVLRLT